MEVVRLRTENWEFADVLVPERFGERLRGLRSFGPDTALLLRSRSVHGFGLGFSFAAVGIDRLRRVQRVEIVEPGSMALFPRARWILELPPDSPLPRVGDAVEVARA